MARGDDLASLVADAYTQHPKDNTFPGEVYLALGVDALMLAGATVAKPIAQEDLLATYVPEARFKVARPPSFAVQRRITRLPTQRRWRR